MELPVVLAVERDGAEFRSRPNRLGRFGAIRVPAAGLEALTGYFTRTFGVAGTGTTEQRLHAALTLLAGRGEIQDRYVGNHGLVATHCRRAGVGYEHRWFDSERWRTTSRRVPLLRATEPNGFLRVVSAELRTQAGDEDAAFDVLLDEEFVDPAAGHPEDVHTGYSHYVHLGYPALTAVAGLLEDRLDLVRGQHPDERAEVLLTGLVARGELGAHLPPGGIRDRFAAWCAEVPVPARIGGRPRKHRILRAGAMVLEVVLWADWKPPKLWFLEAYRAGADRWGGTEYRVSAPIGAVPVLAESFERRLGLPPGAGWAEDRLIACFDALARLGHLDGGLPRQGNRGLVADWVAEAGVVAEVEGFARTEKVLKFSRPATDCLVEFVLDLDPAAPAGRGVVFREKYEYLPGAGDAGREYSYSVTTAYGSLPALLAHLETGPGEGDPEERLTRCFQELVRTGHLHTGLALEAARDRVAALFVAAGVPAVTGSSHWISGD